MTMAQISAQSGPSAPPAPPLLPLCVCRKQARRFRGPRRTLEGPLLRLGLGMDGAHFSRVRRDGNRQYPVTRIEWTNGYASG